MNRLVVALCLTLGSLGLRAQSSPNYQAVAEEIADELVRRMRGEDIPGAAIALIDGQRLIWAQGFGYADAEDRRLVASDTPFVVGDFTKLVTAIAVLRQVEAGRMALDAPVDRYLPGLDIRNRFDNAAIPTIRQLLTHHGGLPNNRHADSYRAAAAATVPRFDDLYLAQPPGTIYAYSHLGFDLLGAALEAVTGETYADHVTAAVLAPLDMENSGFEPPADVVRPHNKRGRPQPPVYPRDLPALGLISSVRDISRLARWFLADAHQPVLGTKWVREMARSQNEDVPLDLDNRMGLVWQLTNTGRHNVDRVLRLNTITIQNRGLLLLAPEQKLGVVVLANSSGAGQAVTEVARLALDAMLEAKHGIARPEAVDKRPEWVGLPHRARPDVMRLRYNTALGQIEFDGDPEGYDMAFVGRRFRTERRDDGWHQISYRLLGFINLRFSVLAEILLRPVRVSDRHLLLIHYRGGTFLLGSAFDSVEDGQEDWVGDYRLSNPGVLSERLELDEIRIVEEYGQLFVTYRFPTFITLRPKVPILPLGMGRFYVPGLGTNMGDELVLRRLNQQRVVQFSGWVFVEKP